MQTFVRALAAIYLIFVALCLLVITPALNYFPARYVAEHYGRQLDSEWIVLNPFKLSLDFQRLALSETDGTPFMALGESSVNLSLASLWRQGIVLDELRITGLQGNVAHLGEGAFNFSDLLPAPTTQEEPVAQDSGDSVGITVNRFEFAATSITVTDRARTTPYSATWENINLQAAGISTVFEEGQPYTLALTGPEGGRLEWQGTLSVAGAYSNGSLAVTDLSLADIGKIAAPWVAFTVDSGRLSISGDYTLDWSDALDYGVQNGNVAIRGLTMLPKDRAELAETALKLAALNVSGIRVDGAAYNADIARLTVDGLQVDGWMADEQISLVDMFVGASGAEPPQQTQPVAAAAENEPPWSASVAQIDLNGSGVNWRSPFTEPAVTRIHDIEASIAQLRWPLQGDSAVALALTINDTAQLQTEGTLNLGSGDGTLRYSLDALALPWLNPNLPATLNAAISKGNVNLSGEVTLRAFAPDTVALDGAITDFALNPKGSDSVLTGWDRVHLDGLSVNLPDSQLQLQRVAIDSYWGYLHIAPDGSINTSDLFIEQTPDDATQGVANGADSATTQDTADDTATASAEASDEVGDSPAAAPWQIDIPEITLADSLVDFADQSLPIPFRTVIGDLNGSVLGLSSAPDSEATVDIKGAVGGSAPVTLSGTVAPLVTPLALDLALTFEGMDMALLTPYSGTYAGYEIERGLLNLELQYKLANNLLKGNNHIVMDQLKLGDKIDSDKAINAPLELAIAIMTDSRGVIDMKVPVKGDVSAPGFEIGGLVAKALLGLIREAVTAPFSLLANLVGSEDDLQHVSFPAGSAELGEAGHDKLMQLVTALAQRPGIDLVILGSVNPESDREQLQRRALDRALLAAGLSEQALAAKDEAWAQAIGERYEQLPAPAADTAAPSVREQYLAVVSAQPLSEGALAELARQRAAAVKHIVVTEGGLDPTRAVIGARDDDTDDGTFSGATLEIN